MQPPRTQASPTHQILSVREEEIRRRRWRNNAGRSCAVPIDEAKAARQQQELEWPVVVGSLHRQLQRASVVALRFLLRFPAFSQKEQNGPFFTFSWRFQTELTPRTLHRAPVGQGPPGPDWLVIAFGFWSGRALATGTAWAGLCLIHHHHKAPTRPAARRRWLLVGRAREESGSSLVGRPGGFQGNSFRAE